MTTVFSKEELIRYSQQLKLPEMGIEGQNKLKNTKVLCVGAGGLGSPVLLYLAAAGIGKLGIIDPDAVELSNLQRQILFQHQHVGSLKSHTAQQQLAALNPTLSFETYTEKLNEDNANNIIQHYDIVADCSDNFATRYLINDVCFNLNKPFVSASIAQFTGQCLFFLNKNTPCYRCLYPEPPQATSFVDCREGGVLGVLPGLLGTIQATEIIKWALQVGELLIGKLCVVDVLKVQFRQFNFLINEECIVHRERAKN